MKVCELHSRKNTRQYFDFESFICAGSIKKMHMLTFWKSFKKMHCQKLVVRRLSRLGTKTHEASVKHELSMQNVQVASMIHEYLIFPELSISLKF